MADRARPVVATGTWPLSRLLIAVAFLLLLLMVFVTAGAWKGGPDWLGWAGLTAFTAAFLLP
jgi:hypothetical protein